MPGLWLACALQIPCGPATADESVSFEYKVKAAFLYNFSRFVEWPESDSKDFRLCVFSHDPFNHELQQLAGRPVGTRELVITLEDSVEALPRCQMVFVSRAVAPGNEDVLKHLKDSPVLTVGESDQFTRNGGIIRFVIDDGKVRFLINSDAARRAGLTISSRLLRLSVPPREDEVQE